MAQKDKIVNSIHLLEFKRGKNVNCREGGPVAEFEGFVVREGLTSL